MRVREFGGFGVRFVGFGLKSLGVWAYGFRAYGVYRVFSSLGFSAGGFRKPKAVLCHI